MTRSGTPQRTLPARPRSCPAPRASDDPRPGDGRSVSSSSRRRGPEHRRCPAPPSPGGLRMTLSTPSLSADQLGRRDALTGRLFEATLGAWDLLAAHLGLDLGFYQALADHGPMTAPQLARTTGADARYAREWLAQQGSSAGVDVDDTTADADERRFSLPAGHAEALLDADSLSTVVPMI